MTRSPSLQARVAIASALSAAIVIGAIAAAFAVFLRVNGSRQLDLTLDSVILAAPTTTAMPAVPIEPALQPTPTSPTIDAARTESLGGVVVRARDILVEGSTPSLLSLAVPEDPLIDAIRRQQVWVAAAAATAIAAAAGLGWLFAGRAVRPLQRLAAATHTVGAAAGSDRPSARGARETEELADAIGQMLDRIAVSQKRTGEALASARDFAAASAHELRTPLTSMRTDLEVLATVPLADGQRTEILHDLLATQRQVEATLVDLERLALGELADPSDREMVDLAELADRGVQESRRAHPGVAVDLHAPDQVVVRGLPAGLRLVLDNAVTNAVRHGDARRVQITVDRADGDAVLIVDDDGSGVPETERQAVFDRFVRGSTASSEGSGLGLALVAQQAALHGGAVALTTGPLGGARLTLRMPPADRERADTSAGP
ncbi:hypothetical protein GCM10023094_01860 [Rhodococcus olei]|uniref:histidine kinase n=1 Tax=Rhodococcus olei TaxID=2161675 RepID=A0ABP8NU14_9NOCA